MSGAALAAAYPVFGRSARAIGRISIAAAASLALAVNGNLKSIAPAAVPAASFRKVRLEIGSCVIALFMNGSSISFCTEFEQALRSRFYQSSEGTQRMDSCFEKLPLNFVMPLSIDRYLAALTKDVQSVDGKRMGRR